MKARGEGNIDRDKCEECRSKGLLKSAAMDGSAEAMMVVSRLCSMKGAKRPRITSSGGLGGDAFLLCPPV